MMTARTERTGVAAAETEMCSGLISRIPNSPAGSHPRTRLWATLQFSFKASAKEANHQGGGKYLLNSLQ